MEQMQNVQKCCSKIVELIKEGHFGVGSSAPKIQASIYFVKDGGGKAIITSLEYILDAVAGKEGTTITI